MGGCVMGGCVSLFFFYNFKKRNKWYAPLLFGTSQSLHQGFYEKGSSLFLAFIDNIFFSITQPFNSVNMTLSVGKTDMGLTP